MKDNHKTTTRQDKTTTRQPQDSHKTRQHNTTTKNDKEYRFSIPRSRRGSDRTAIGLRIIVVGVRARNMVRIRVRVRHRV
jgi:hypothetical protein